jgi:hypothetical protein
MAIYWEQQRGGLCRLHALNAFFGYARLNENDFYNLSNEFDKRQLYLFRQTCSAQNYDVVGSDQMNLVSYILSKFGVATKYFALNERPSQIDGVDRFFVYDMGHIWLMLNDNNDGWKKVDSLSGVSPLNLDRCFAQKNVGYMVPIANLANEYSSIVSQIFGTYTDIKKNYLGNDEILIGRAVELLRIQLAHRSKKYPHIEKLIDDYYRYISELSKGRYNDPSFVCHKIPNIIAFIKGCAPPIIVKKI